MPTGPAASSSSNAAWPPASRASRTSCSTTGKPACSSATLAEAARARNRPCKRCRPEGDAATANDRAVADASQYLVEHADESVTLADLSAKVGVSAFHLQRAFKRALGVSPREFHDAQR